MTKQREHWGTRLGFILATAGSAIGLGSLWRFPYVAGENGGGLFVLFYLFFTFAFGIPLFIGELIIGRASQKSSVGAYNELSGRSSNWKLVGWLSVLTCFIILSFYNVICGWALNYAFMSLNQFTKHFSSPEQISQVFDIMMESGDICIFWHFIFMLLNIGIVFTGIRKGIEYWSKLLMPVLLSMLVGLFIYVTTLDGFGPAVDFLFTPRLESLKPSTLLTALGMALFTLSLGLGIIITYGSYMKSDDNLITTSLTIQFLNIGVTLMASLIIFPIIFTSGLDPESGPGLVFKTLPVLFAQMPGALVISSVFFILMVFTALTSTISLFEVIIANFMELYNWSRKKSCIIIGTACFLFGIPSALCGTDTLFSNWKAMYGTDFLTTLSDLADWLLPMGCLLASLFIGWKMDKKLLKEQFNKGSNAGNLFPIWYMMLKWIIPFGIILVILQKGDLIKIDEIFAFSLHSS